MNTSISPAPADVLGIDMSKTKFNAHLLPSHGGGQGREFANTPEGFHALDQWLRQLLGSSGRTRLRLHAGVEATGNYALPLLMHLHARAHIVSYLNPRRVKDFTRCLGRKAKTDPVDAHDIALMVQRLRPSSWVPPPAERCELQALVRHRRDLVAQITANDNRLKTVHCHTIITSLRLLLKHLRKLLKDIDGKIERHTLAHLSLQRDARLLQSIPGFGKVVSATILAEVPRMEDFSRARDLVAFAGMAPTTATSGSSVRRRGRLSKEGCPLLRHVLYMAAMTVVARKNTLRSFYDAMVARGMARACALGALMSRLLRIAFGVLKHQTPFVENFARLPSS